MGLFKRKDATPREAKPKVEPPVVDANIECEAIIDIHFEEQKGYYGWAYTLNVHNVEGVQFKEKKTRYCFLTAERAQEFAEEAAVELANVVRKKVSDDLSKQRIKVKV